MKNISIHKGLLTKTEAADFIAHRDEYEKVGNVYLYPDDRNREYIELIKERIKPYAMEYVKDTPFQDKLIESNFIELIMQDEANNEQLHYDDHIEIKDNSLQIAPIVCLVYLNNTDEDFFGGQLYFPFQKGIVEPKVGTLVVFPTGHFYPHKVLPFSGGKRYLLKMFYYIDSGLDEKDRNYLIRQMHGEHYGYEN